MNEKLYKTINYKINEIVKYNTSQSVIRSLLQNDLMLIQSINDLFTVLTAYYDYTLNKEEYFIINKYCKDTFSSYLKKEPKKYENLFDDNFIGYIFLMCDKETIDIIYQNTDSASFKNSYNMMYNKNSNKFTVSKTAVSNIIKNSNLKKIVDDIPNKALTGIAADKVATTNKDIVGKIAKKVKDINSMSSDIINIENNSINKQLI